MRKIFFGLLAFLACTFIEVQTVQGQSVKGIIKTAVGHLTSLNLEGTWDYEGVAVQFQSDNLLKKAGGKVASSGIESKIDQQLQQIGFKPGVTQFIFDENGSFQNITNGKKVSGTYTYDKSDNKITLKYANHIPLKATVTGSANKVSLLFEANSFLSFVTFLGSHSGISVIDGISSLLKTYDGMMIGMELNKITNLSE